jgi:phage terminase small subunit
MNRPKFEYSPQEKRFCEWVVSGRTPTESAKLAGYPLGEVNHLMNKPRLMKLIVYLLQSRAAGLKKQMTMKDVKWTTALKRAKFVIDKVLDDYTTPDCKNVVSNTEAIKACKVVFDAVKQAGISLAEAAEAEDSTENAIAVARKYLGEQTAVVQVTPKNDDEVEH